MTTTGPDDAAEPMMARSVLLSSIMPPLFLAMIDQTIVSTALPSIAASLGNFERIAWIVVAYLGATAISAPVYGRLGDAFGRRRFMTIALSVSLVGSLLCAAAPTFELLVVARALQGLGGGGLLSLSYALVRQFVSAKTNARYQGYMAAVALGASSLGPVLGGQMTDLFGWRSIFLLNVPIGMLSLLLLQRLPPRRAPIYPLKFDWRGLMLLIAGMLSFLTLVESLRQPGANELTVGAAVASVVFAVVFFRHVARATDPLLPAAFLINPTIRRCAMLALFHGALYASLMTFAPIYLGMVHGLAAANIGLLLLPMTFGVGLGSMLTSFLASRTGKTMIYPSMALFAGAVILLICAWKADELTVVGIAVLLGLVAITMGTVMVVAQMTVMSEAGSRMLAAASSTVTLARSLGASCGTAVVGVVMSVLIGPSVAAYADTPAHQMQGMLAHAFIGVFLVIALFAAVASVLAWSVPRRTL